VTNLNDRLTAQAKGLYTTEAAAIILTHGVRGTLPAKLARAIDDNPTDRYAYIDWDTAVDLSGPFSGGERRLIRLAASLATEHEINAGDTFTGLDDSNGDIVLDAIAHCLRVRR
jgi:hypothetical protein